MTCFRAVIDAGVYDETDDPNAEFASDLQRLLDGIGVLVDERRALGH